MKEEWRDIPGYEGRYQVSNLGKIKSLSRIIKSGNNYKNVRQIPTKVLVPRNQAGYQAVCLCLNGKVSQRRIHRVVAEVFLGLPNKVFEVNHKDGNRWNPCLSNLEWVTHSENMKHGVFVLRHYTGSKPRAVLEIETGKIFESIKSVARHLGVSKQNIQIALNKNYRCRGLRYAYAK